MVLGLVGLIDAKGNDVAQSLWLWGCPALAPKQPKNTKNAFFCLFWSLCQTVSRPYRLSHINALHINQSYTSKDQSQKFSQKNIENWRSPENDFCLVFSFLVFGYWVVQIFFFSQWKTPRRFIWGSVYFCTMDGFFRILEKAVSELICTRLYVLGNWHLQSPLFAYIYFTVFTPRT